MKCHYLLPQGKQSETGICKRRRKESLLSYIHIIMFEGRVQMFKIFLFLIISVFSPYYLSLEHIILPKQAHFSKVRDFAKVQTTACRKYNTYTHITSLKLLVTNPKLMTRSFKLWVCICARL